MRAEIRRFFNFTLDIYQKHKLQDFVLTTYVDQVFKMLQES